MCIIRKRKASQPEANGIVCVCLRLSTQCLPEALGEAGTIYSNRSSEGPADGQTPDSDSPGGLLIFPVVPGCYAAAKESKAMPAIALGNPSGVSGGQDSEKRQGQG